MNERERVLLTGISQGKMIRQAAKPLGITQSNAANILARFYRKIGAVNAAHAVYLCCADGSLPMPERTESAPR